MGKEEKRSSPFAEHGSKAKEQQRYQCLTIASKPVGENEVASRQRNGVPLVEQEVVSEQRRARQEPNLMT